MRQLHFDLLRLLDDDRQDSHGSRRARRYVHGAGGRDAASARLPGSAGEEAEGPAHRGAGGGMAPAGSLRRYGEESHGAPSLAGEEDRQAGDRAQGQRELRGRCAVRDLNFDLLQLQRRAGGDGLARHAPGPLLRAGAGRGHPARARLQGAAGDGPEAQARSTRWWPSGSAGGSPPGPSRTAPRTCAGGRSGSTARAWCPPTASSASPTAST